MYKTLFSKSCHYAINSCETIVLIWKSRKIIKNHIIAATNGHNHTVASDGELNSLRVLLLNWLAGFKCVAVTDHNTLNWNGTEKLYAKYFPIIFHIQFLPGIEFSCFLDLEKFGEKRKEFHIVGIGLDPENAILKKTIIAIQEKRQRITKKMLHKIQEAGFAIISFEELKINSGGNVTLPDIAKNVRTKSGDKVDAEKFIQEHLSAGRDCYVKNSALIPVRDAIEVIKHCGGLVIWAHPKDTLEGLFETDFENIALQLRAMGINGIEAFRYNHNAEEVRRVEVLCRENNLEIRAGSDMHKTKDLFVYIKNVKETLKKDCTL